MTKLTATAELLRASEAVTEDDHARAIKAKKE